MGLCFFGPSLFGLGELSALAAAGLAMTIYSSAFLGEIWRGCIQAVPKNQMCIRDSCTTSGRSTPSRARRSAPPAPPPRPAWTSSCRACWPTAACW